MRSVGVSPSNYTWVVRGAGGSIAESCTDRVQARDAQSTLYYVPTQDWLEDTESDTAFSDRAVEAAETRAQALTNNGGSSSSAAGPPAANSPPKIPSYAPSSTSTGPELDAHKPASHSVNRY